MTSSHKIFNNQKLTVILLITSIFMLLASCEDDGDTNIVYPEPDAAEARSFDKSESRPLGALAILWR